MFGAAAEVAFVLVLAVQAARLVWIVAAPSLTMNSAPAASRPIDEDPLAILTQINPFAFKGAVPQSAEGPEADGKFSLFGVRAAGNGKGSAIIAADGAKQSLFRTGEEIVPGVVLEAVAADHVVLARGERTSRLALVASHAQEAVIPSYLLSPPAAAVKPRPVAVDPKKLIEEAGLLPRIEAGRVTGYTLLPRGGGETLRGAGLIPGDVLVGLNGNQITPERYSELEQELTSSPQVQITVQRGSETKTITLQTGR